ncbi:PREDICTED: uncharacterized protein LOC109342310 [Lupinus angustifolius]|uniref:uncharacterized protein LOC109342310 n=1 Tax=Lupinus angustifolius TaxID=3871 RepID=UPI00092F1990|nr:PREDICTED: uncharacterized protein LOC109342310 [Lupinus angustifolius]
MDKTWISKPHNTLDYLIGLNQFLDFAFENDAIGDTIQSMSKYGFLNWQTRDIAYDHLLKKPFPLNYVIWNLHGEKQVFESTTTQDEMEEACHYENPMETMMNDAFGHYKQQVNNEGVSEQHGTNEILNEGRREDHSFIDEFLKDDNQKLYEGSSYTKLEFIIKLYHIKVLCGLSDKAMTLILDLLTDAFEEVKLPPSVYESKKIINKLDPRNVCLGLATDGFNPFGTLSSTYSIWPCFLWIAISSISPIGGRSQYDLSENTPGNNIDVYLRPLVEELKELWNDGVETFDSSSNETFRMRAALMWTISDFPSLGILSGWNTHTGLACPTCNFDAEPCRLPHSSKWCFMGHRRFLSRNHKLRLIRARFDGSTEERNPPSKLSGSDIFRQVENINVTFGKGAKLNGLNQKTILKPKNI